MSFPVRQRGSFGAAIASFDKPAVKSLTVDLAGVDPRVWHTAAPTADLYVKGDARAQRGDGPRHRHDRDRQPRAGSRSTPSAFRRAARPRRSRLDARQLKFEPHRRAVAAGFGQRRVLAVAFAERRLADAREAGRRRSGAPARRPAAAARRRPDAGARRPETPFSSPPICATAASRRQRSRSTRSFTPSLATINSARLALGDGFATAGGSIELSGAHRADLQGSLQRFEPGRLVKGVDARLSGSMSSRWRAEAAAGRSAALRTGRQPRLGPAAERARPHRCRRGAAPRRRRRPVRALGAAARQGRPGRARPLARGDTRRARDRRTAAARAEGAARRGAHAFRHRPRQVDGARGGGAN